MRNPDIIPQKDADFDIFQQNILSAVSAQQAQWQVPQNEINALLNRQQQWTAAWDAAKIKTSRTPAQVTAKQEARQIFVAALRPFIQQYIVHNPLVTDSEKLAMHIQPRKKTRTRIAVPDTVPNVAVSAKGMAVGIYFSQQQGASGCGKRAMPKGAVFAEMRYALDTMPQSPAQCTGNLIISRSPYFFEAQPLMRGRKVNFFLRWVNPRGEGGVWSSVFSFTMP